MVTVAVIRIMGYSQSSNHLQCTCGSVFYVMTAVIFGFKFKVKFLSHHSLLTFFNRSCNLN